MHSVAGTADNLGRSTGVCEIKTRPGILLVVNVGSIIFDFAYVLGRANILHVQNWYPTLTSMCFGLFLPGIGTGCAKMALMSAARVLTHGRDIGNTGAIEMSVYFTDTGVSYGWWNICCSP